MIRILRPKKVKTVYNEDNKLVTYCNYMFKKDIGNEKASIISNSELRNNKIKNRDVSDK